jgi:prevent-host-death family protein
MEKTIAAFEARRQFGQLLQAVEGRKDRIIVEKHGQAVAVIVPMEVYEQWRGQWERAFDLIELAASRAAVDEDEAELLATEAVAHVRATTSP